MSEAPEASPRDSVRPRKKPKPEICRCLCLRAEHKNGRGACDNCAARGLSCKRYKARGRPKPEIPEDLKPPDGAIVLLAPDTKTSVVMGWATLDDADLVIYVSQLITKRPNEFKGISRLAAIGRRRANARCRDRSESAVLQATARLCDREADLSRPSRVTLVRVSNGRIGDDDGIVGALKYVRDGVAKALGFDDSHFSINGKESGKIPLVYEQMVSGAAKVCGVFIEIGWTS